MNRGCVVMAVLIAALLILPRAIPAQEAPAETPKAEPAAAADEAKEPDQPEDEARKKQLVTNMFYDTSLRQALSDIAAQTGVIIVPDLSVQGIVTCELKDVPLEDALRMVLSVGDFEFRQMEGYILVGSVAPDGPSFTKLSDTKVVHLTHIKAETAVKMLSKSMQKYANANVGGGKILVTAPPGVLDRIAADLKKLDQPPRHVLLDARVVVMEEGRLRNLGIQWDWPQLLAGTFSTSELHGKDVLGSRWPWAVQIGLTQGSEFTSALLLTLNLLAQNDEATIVASPQMMTQDGKEAEIKVETEEFFIILTEEQYARSELEKIGSGIMMKITPRVSEEGDINMELSVEVSDVVARGENNLPVVTRRVATSTVRVQDGGTAAVAGLMDDRSQRLGEWIPVLGRLPLIGPLFFRSRVNTSSSRQVAVFITARLVPEGRAASDLEARPNRPAYAPVNRRVFRRMLRTSLMRLAYEDAKSRR